MSRKRRLREALAAVRLQTTWQLRARQKLMTRTPVPGLVVSLTSYPRRFETLALTLKSLILQSVRPEAVLLWVASADIAEIPDEIRQLETYGVRILECADVRSYNKFTHAIAAYPTYRIAICDDDTYYPPHWLADLLTPVNADEIACHRSHVIKLDKSGHPAPYDTWLQEGGSRHNSPLNFGTGVGGILIEPGKFHQQISDMGLARSLAPTADDIWLYMMARRAGSTFVKVGPVLSFLTWPTSQKIALWQTNVVENANDVQMRALLEHFGTEGLFA